MSVFVEMIEMLNGLMVHYYGPAYLLSTHTSGTDLRFALIF